MGVVQPRTLISHLLRRAAFGDTEAEIQRYMALGFERAVDTLLHPERIPDTIDQMLADQVIDTSTAGGLQTAWLVRMRHTQRPLLEKMTLFWHGHFATAISKVRDPLVMQWQNDTFRLHALGNFRDLAHAMARDPAMLRWLDGNQNRKAAPNENFVRELMELFTIGIGNYSEDDVKAGARSFTGWHIDPTVMAFTFRPGAHDYGVKAFLGQSGSLDGGDVIDALVAHPSTGRRLATRLFKFFVHDEPSVAEIDRLAAIYSAEHFEIRPMLQAIFYSPEFRSEKAYHALVKSPTELVIGSLKQLQAETTWQDILPAMRRMGQELFNPPNVKGWDGGRGWVSTSTLLERYNVASRMVTARNDPTRTSIDPAQVLTGSAAGIDGLVDHCLQLLVDGDVAPEVRSELIQYVRSGPGAAEQLTPAAVDEKVRGLLHLIMSLPVYQMN
ncbi:MAG: DUF1800 domain-containing protein [Chloroflexota bacterium]